MKFTALKLDANSRAWYKWAGIHFMDNKLYIFDCISGKLRVAEGALMPIGHGEGNVFRCQMSVDVGGTFALRGRACYFFPHGSVESYSLNGRRESNEAIIPPGMLNLLVLAGGCFICWVGSETDLPDFGSVNPQEWYVYDPLNGSQGPHTLAELLVYSALPASTPVAPAGLTSRAFLLGDMLEVARLAAREEASRPSPRREVTCPHCWQRFRLEHTLAIAAHPTLNRDSILGEYAQQRFTPIDYDAQGYPVDSMGISVSEYACPWCHHKLPPFFASTAQHIVSLIGAPEAGKTYYLASMLRELEYTLPREFGIAFRDADPSANAAFNALRAQLYTAATPLPRQAPLYHAVWKGGCYTSLPCPFIYNLSTDEKSLALVFYDTAGADCAPEATSLQNPAVGHLVAASLIIFYFDPTVDPAFRKLLSSEDGLPHPAADAPEQQQALLLSEAEMRLRTALHLPPGHKLQVPLAVVIGKSDTWQNLLGAEPLLPVVSNGQYRPALAEANSERLRQLLFSISPQICSNAEAISTHVAYFAASALGTPPAGEPQPNAGKMHPDRVAEPLLWALHMLDDTLLSNPA
ncbi:MAG: hypothetical protein J1E42_04275 [Akkermansiaceae bacterium]|nr:hypothetical protein [Akkermansiaceae bacterium]